MMNSNNMIPINEFQFERVEIPDDKQVIFTSLVSSKGQGVIPASVRAGEDTAPEFIIPAGCKVELQIKAVYYPILGFVNNAIEEKIEREKETKQ